ncbi:MAG TPA: adenylate/guanylate cyclase domain-containing protein [Mycobacteriales bacterium]|nr:adenylate/guanylate cyclase domain-containing protein [Mycobacteriales bacterium]
MRAGDNSDREVRKIVTVIFTDVAGFTSLSAHLDPESLRRVMSRYYEVASAVLSRHGGTVEKFIGDAVMAVFGVPKAHEDDAVRAVRAAHELRAALESLNDELAAKWAVRLQVRTGVNTGEVVAATPTTGPWFVVGDAVNVAARLEQSAAPGDVLIGDTTYRLVRHEVVAEPIEDLWVKGKDGALRAYRLVAVGVDDGARVHAPLVGRGSELSLLLDTFALVRDNQTCRLQTVLGWPGIGKSRLVAELVRRVESEARVLRGRCLPYGEGLTYWPLADVVKQAAGINDDDTPDAAYGKVSTLVPAQTGRLVAERVAALIGLSDVPVPAEEVAWSVRRLLEGLAAAGPLVVIFEDLHWAEQRFLDVLEHLAERVQGVALLVVCTARPELLDARPSWTGGMPRAGTVHLEPLRSRDAELLVDELLGADSLDADVRARVVAAADGSPLFLEQLLSMLVDDEMLQLRDGRWVLIGELTLQSVPPTIHALVAARLDQLEAGERTAVERAAVIGHEFRVGELAALVGSDSADLSTDLARLVRKGLLRRSETLAADEQAYAFQHIIVRDVGYARLPKTERARLHEQFAHWLITTAGDRVREYEEIVGYHFEQACRLLMDLGPVDDRSRAIAVQAAARLSSAGRRAMTLSDMTAAASLLHRAALLPVPADDEHLNTLLDLGFSLVQAGELARGEQVLDDLTRLAAESGSRALEARAEVQHLFLTMHTKPKQFEVTAPAAATRLWEEFRRLGDELGMARALRLRALAFWVRLEFGRVSQELDGAVTHARQAGHTQEVAEIEWLQASTAMWGPLPAAEAIARVTALLERTEGNLKLRANCLLRLGGLAAMAGDFDAGRKLVFDGRALLADLGLHFFVAGSAQISGLVELLAGDAVAAEEEFTRGYGYLRDLGEKAHFSTLAAHLAQTSYLLGRYDDAARFAGESEEATEGGDTFTDVVCGGVRAKLLARAGRCAEALADAERVVATAATTEHLLLRADSWLDRADVLRSAGDTAAAMAAVTRASDLYAQKGATPAFDRVATLAGW